MTAPINWDLLKGIVNDPNKVKELPPLVAAKINADLAARDATSVGTTLSSIEQAKREMELYGITSEQRTKGYTGKISESLYNAVKPVGYQGHGLQIFDAIKSMVNPKSAPIVDSGSLDGTFDHPFRRGDEDPGKGGFTTPSREDSWRLYLVLPQVHNTFGISDYRPANSKEDKTYFRLNDLKDGLLFLRGVPDVIKELQKSDGEKVMYDQVLGHFTAALGKDERGHYISYYDKWDLDKFGSQFAGHPYEVYDRIYYDPKTFQPIPDKLVSLHHEDTKAEIQKWLSSVTAK